MTKPSTPSRSLRTIVPGVIAVVAIGLAIIAATNSSDDVDTTGNETAAPITSTEITSSDDAPASATAPPATTDGASGPDTVDAPLSLGDPAAPVVMIEYAEFQCPFCGQFARETKPELVERYVDTGIMRIEWRDFPYLGEESYLAALGGRAAAAQGQFWSYHDALYADQAPSPNSGRLTDQYLIDVASEIGLDVAKFETDLREATYDDDIRNDFESGIKDGVNGTPAFFINGVPVFGAQPVEVFIEAIDTAAASAS